MVTLRQFVKDFEAAVHQAMISNSVKLAKGQCSDFAEYKRQVGVNQGLEGSVSVMRDMLRQIEDAEQDSRLPEMPQAGGK